MLPRAADHVARVEAWLHGVDKRLPPAQLAEVFERALGALWARAVVTLGDVTLTAIVDRVLYTATERYAFLSTLKMGATGIRFDEFRKGAVQYRKQLPEVVRFVLAEFLTMLGRLTDEILTPALHAELSKVGLERSRRVGGDDEDSEGAAR